MEHPEHQTSAFKTWILILFFVAIVAFQGWLAFTVIGDLGQPDYYPLPYAQHVLKEQGQEENPKHLYVIPFDGVE
jgi:hypothetical protein